MLVLIGPRISSTTTRKLPNLKWFGRCSCPWSKSVYNWMGNDPFVDAAESTSFPLPRTGKREEGGEKTQPLQRFTYHLGIQGSRIRFVLGCVIPRVGAVARSHNLGQALFGSSVRSTPTPIDYNCRLCCWYDIGYTHVHDHLSKMCKTEGSTQIQLLQN